MTRGTRGASPSPIDDVVIGSGQIYLTRLDAEGNPTGERTAVGMADLGWMAPSEALYEDDDRRLFRDMTGPGAYDRIREATEQATRRLREALVLPPAVVSRNHMHLTYESMLGDLDRFRRRYGGGFGGSMTGRLSGGQFPLTFTETPPIQQETNNMPEPYRWPLVAYPITFVESYDERSSIYRDARGTEVHIANGRLGVRLFNLDEVDLDAVAETFRPYAHPWNHRVPAAIDWESFSEVVRERLIDPDEFDDVYSCVDCAGPATNDVATVVAGGDVACPRCLDDEFTLCERTGCDEYHRNRTFNTVTVAGGSEQWCPDCRQQGAPWCDRCDEYYDGDLAREHRHGDCDCEPNVATTHFTLPGANGLGLAHDTLTPVNLPKGIISTNGLNLISQRLMNHARAELDAQRVDRQGYLSIHYAASEAWGVGEEYSNDKGRYTRRLSSACWRKRQVRLPDSLLTEIGNIAREHSAGVDLHARLTRNLNMDAEEYANSGSCWWSEEGDSRCALKANGGMALLTYGDDDPEFEFVTGRAWVMPVKYVRHSAMVNNPVTGITPTTSENPDGYVVFNGYGDLDNGVGGRALSAMTGMGVRRIEFYSSPMYINSSAAQLVGADDWTGEHLTVQWSLQTHNDLYATEQDDLYEIEQQDAEQQDAEQQDAKSEPSARLEESLADWERELLAFDADPNFNS